MGKKGSWFSAIKRVFISNSKEKLANESEKKGVKEKKRWGIGRLKHGDKHSFIPLYREPSSIEKILGDVERDHQRTLSMPSREPQGTPPLPIRDQQSSPSMPSVDHQQPHSMSMRAHHYKVIQSPNYHQIAATKIQTAYRGYMARRSFRALKGLVRLQGVVRGQSVRRQTMNAMRCMQLLVRVQSQIHSRRIQMMENQALQRQNLHKVDKELESCLSKGTLTEMAEAEDQEEWDDSLLTREEIEARMQRKVEAVIKRERALAYAYSHQLWKATPKSAHTALMEIRSGGFPWWWSWIERQLPAQALDNTIMHARNILTPPKPNTEPTIQLRPNNYRQAKLGIDVFDAATPKSAKSSPAVRMRHMLTPTIKTPQADTSTQLRHMKARASMDEHFLGAKPLRDDESLTSCPPFSVPNYMVPTVSAKAKVRAHSIPKERSTGQELKKRLSFPLRQSIGSLFTGKDSASQRFSRDHKSIQSIGNVSVDSTLSLPATVGRKPFQRFV